MNVFKFRPIGQGLFYTGSLFDGKYNFVYDCGTDSAKCYLDKEIDKLKFEIRNHDSNTGKPILNFVVISHLHKDHISGLQQLLKKFKVKQLYLPYIYDKDITLLTFAVNLIADGVTEEKIQLFRFVWEIYSEQSYMGTEITFLRGRSMGAELVSGDIYDYFTKQIGDPSWNFYLILKQVKEETLQELRNRLNKLLSTQGISDLRTYFAEFDYQEIQKIYKAVFSSSKNLNATSTLLLHFPSERVLFKKFVSSDYKICLADCFEDFNRYCCRKYLTLGVTLLTGDAEFDENIDKNIKNILNYKNIDVAQIPHHGSKANWQKMQKCNLYVSNYVVPFGLGNRYKHPSSEVVDYLISNNKALYCVNQLNGFYYYLFLEN